MTPVEFYYAMEDFQERFTQEADGKIKAIYDSMRIQTMYLHNISPNTKKKYRKAKSFMLFGWEKETKKQQSVEDMKSIMMSMAKSVNRNIKKKG